jgi:hypothetical protein
MSLRKRRNTWWIDVTTPSGQRIRESAETPDRKAAQEYHDRVKAEAWRRHKLGDKPRRTWDEAALRFLKEAEGKASLKEYERQVAFWTGHFKGSRWMRSRGMAWRICWRSTRQAPELQPAIAI